MIRLEQVSPADINGEDIAWLHQGCKNSIEDVAPIDHVESAIAGRSGIYRVHGDAVGIVVMTVKGKGLEITALAGKGFLRHFAAVHDAILVTAAGAGAEFVCGYVKRAGLASMYKKHTNASTAEYFKEELFV